MSETNFALPQPGPNETGPYVLIATAHAKPERAEDFLVQLHTLLDASNKEPGAIAINLHRDRFNPNIFVLYEVWRDINALTHHITQPHTTKFGALLLEYLTQDLDICWLTTETMAL